MSNTPSNFKDRVLTQKHSLFVSAGHSYSDPGASGNGWTEADIVLELRDLLYRELDSRGIVLSTDGEKGENLPLRQAVQMAKEHEVAVELHCNAFHKPSATGVETLSSGWQPEFDAELCDCISRTLGIANRGAKGEGSGQHSRLAFVSKGHGTIIELFFITNQHDLRSYLDRKEELVIRLADVLEDQVCK